ncbi:unnamed protein product [Triticum turgidum subsp. durum]|uniref:Uncharacterized protein n=1 Tax=Triticum turgidum subsp. durum TaxID=4567 RepID=A0A9R0VM77_TRITD|nr:unnamed protein product [Triticum turgidum subsp. durum]
MSSVLLAGGELSGYHTSEAVDLCIQTTPDEHDFLWAHQGYELEETRTCTQPWLVVMVGLGSILTEIDEYRVQISGIERCSIPSRSGDDLDEDDDGYGCEIGTLGNFKKSKGTVNMSATYNTRNNDIESSVVARGDLWRLEASRSGSTSGNDTSPLYLVQLGPLLFVRDSTLLLPVHLSKQHLLWYGYDRKNGVHSLCPAIWSKQRRWLMMSMMCLNPVACSFMDLQFPNGQVTYVAGEGITASGFVPLFGGLLQAHGKFPGETRMSFSCKNKRGTRFTPMFQWPDKSLSLGVTQALAYKRSGLMVRPSIQVRCVDMMLKARFIAAFFFDAAYYIVIFLTT